jgi:ABC-2 type transport system permease protein
MRSRITSSIITAAPAAPLQARSLSRPVSAWTIIWATTLKELQIAGRYLPNLAGNFVELAIRVGFFFLLASVVALNGSSGPALAGRDLFIFFQGGLLLFVFNRPTVWGPIQAVTDDLYNGALEYLYSTPCSRYAYYVGAVLARVLINMVIFLPLYLVLILSSSAGLGNMLMVLLACLLILIALTAMGIMIAILALLWRQVSSIANILSILFEMLAGAYIPITAFPEAAQYLAYLLPYTWGYDLIRYYSFGGHWPTLLPVWQEWLVISLFALLFTLLSRYLLARAEQQAKQNGLHII